MSTTTSSRYVTKNGRTMKRGLFSNGVWHCDCDPRMPADKFQTKNGGKNHGRWFYTCQKPTPKKCSFFLWEDDAKVREEGAVLNNSRTEPAEPRTPKKIGTPIKQTKLPTQMPTPSTKSKTPAKLEAVSPPADDFDEWSADDADLAEALDEFETPRKAQRQSYDDSPTKQARMSNESYASSVTLPLHEDPNEVFSTPSTSRKPPLSSSNGNNATPTKPPGIDLSTPSSSLATNTISSADPGPLATEVLSILEPLSPPTHITTQLTALLNTQELCTTGISKGRDIARVALQTKERKITELETRIKGLEMEKETMRSVVGILKRDIKDSPKRPRRPKEDKVDGDGEESGGWEKKYNGGGGGGGEKKGARRGGWEKSVV